VICIKGEEESADSRRTDQYLMSEDAEEYFLKVKMLKFMRDLHLSQFKQIARGLLAVT
jgi:hypothetical protein